MTTVKELQDEISILYDKIKQIQKECGHPLLARTIVNKSDTGHWDRNDDSYWTDHHCGMCDLRWTTSQDWQHIGSKRGLPEDDTYER